MFRLYWAAQTPEGVGLHFVPPSWFQWDELYASRPDDNYEDRLDVEEIQHAKENMGDFKLKSAEDYVVPDRLRMNVEKARGRLVMLKCQVGTAFMVR